MMMPSLVRIVVPCVAVLLGTTAVATTAQEEQQQLQRQQQQSVLQVAAANENLSTFVNLLEAAGLSDRLMISKGPFTVFAPTNQAFDALDGDLFSKLKSPEYVAHLTEFLECHVLQGPQVYTTDVLTSEKSVMTVTALSGESFDITKYSAVSVAAANAGQEGLSTLTQQQQQQDGGDAVIAIDGNEIVKADIPAANGVLHIVAGTVTPAWEIRTLVQTIQSQDNLKILNWVIQDAALTGDLAADGPYTVFAPSNEAIDAVDIYIQDCLAGNVDWLKSVIQYHIVPDMVPSAVLTSGMFTTVYGEPITIDGEAGTVNGVANITVNDGILAMNGIGHKIDAVLLPSTLQDKLFQCADNVRNQPLDNSPPAPIVPKDKTDGTPDESTPNVPRDFVPSTPESDATTLSDSLAQEPSLSTFTKLLEDANILDGLTGTGTDSNALTVFAPTDSATAAVPEQVLDCIVGNETVLQEVLEYHIVQVAFTAADIRNLGADIELGTVQGEDVAVNGVNGTVNTDAVITGPDIIVISGSSTVVHAIERVLIPPSLVQHLYECTGFDEEEDDIGTGLATRGGFSAATSHVGMLVSAVLGTALAAWMTL